MLETFQSHPVAKKVREVGEAIDETADYALNQLREGMKIFNNSRWNRFCNSSTGRILMVAGLVADIGAASHIIGESKSVSPVDEPVKESLDAEMNSDGVEIRFGGAPDWMKNSEVEKSVRDEADALRVKLESSGKWNHVVVHIAFYSGDSVVAEGVDALPNQMFVGVDFYAGNRDQDGSSFSCHEFFSDPLSADQIHTVLQSRGNEMSYIAPGQASSLVGDDLSNLGHDLFVPISAMATEEAEGRHW